MNRFGVGVFADQPIGPPVDLRPAKRPERTTLAGRHVTLVPLDADEHADQLSSRKSMLLRGKEKKLIEILFYIS